MNAERIYQIKQTAQRATGLDCPRIEGRIAAIEGASRDACPYPVPGKNDPLSDRECWLIGYDGAVQRGETPDDWSE